MSAVALLCGIIAQSGKVAEADYRDCEGYGDIVASGLLRLEGLVQSVSCYSCDIGHEAPIICEDGCYGHFCPDAGFVTVERSDLIAIVPDFNVLAAQIGEALGCKGRRPQCIAWHTWYIGMIRTEAADIAVYFHSRLQTARDLQSLEAALRSQVRTRFGLVLTASGTLAVPSMTTAPLDQVLSFDTAHHRLYAVVDVSAVVDAPVIRKGGRPATHTDRIEAIVADRAAHGRAGSGKNAEVRAIQAEYEAKFPGDDAPSRSAVMRYLSKLQSGS